MGITSSGRRNAFRKGLLETINKMEVRDGSTVIDERKDITMSYDNSNAGRIVLDGTVDYSVNQNDQINKIVLINDSTTGNQGEQWEIDLGDGYDFDYDGTFTVEDVWVQFTGPSDPEEDGGITKEGRKLLMEGEMVDKVNLIGTNASDWTATEKDIQDDPIDFDTSGDTLTLEKEFQMETNDYPSSIDNIILQNLDSDDNVTDYFHLKFSERSFDYPARLTITEIEIDIT